MRCASTGARAHPESPSLSGEPQPSRSTAATSTPATTTDYSAGRPDVSLCELQPQWRQRYCVASVDPAGSEAYNHPRRGTDGCYGGGKMRQRLLQLLGVAVT